MFNSALFLFSYRSLWWHISYLAQEFELIAHDSRARIRPNTLYAAGKKDAMYHFYVFSSHRQFPKKNAETTKKDHKTIHMMKERREKELYTFIIKMPVMWKATVHAKRAARICWLLRFRGIHWEARTLFFIFFLFPLFVQFFFFLVKCFISWEINLRFMLMWYTPLMVGYDPCWVCNECAQFN